jgi:hypothetical protein
MLGRHLPTTGTSEIPPKLHWLFMFMVLSFLTFCKKDIRQETARCRARPLADWILMSLADIVI